MRVLALDGSAVAASACVVEDDRILGEFYSNTGLTHSQTLMPMVDATLRCANLPLDSIDLFAVSNGPGSFTGVRIAVATVKGLAAGTGKRCAAVSTLEAAAWNLISGDCIACAVMDARCRQVYTASFVCNADETMRRLTPDEAVSIEELGKRLLTFDRKVVLVGDCAQLCYNECKDQVPGLAIAPPHLRFQQAHGVAFCALHAAPCQDSALQPSYLRLPQAQRDLKKRKGEAVT